ncbi:multidrug transporter MATE [Stenotrophomonas daejeonensis]|uniref:Multidrug transporter MATE n=1 Tax=Stenotrophomonas daejeonensis TaxID=659018 RepID=A0A0R0E0A9_9GAMM|nr:MULTISPECIES: MATE family efflux transporter [Stenotrophomonas]KRG83422.1 multidrug transporter MATE [Stenotrophomonas daejeonensis]MCG8277082.1 MATE family efflux transporter [Stenotrophomonas sp. NLF4-10]
MTATPASLPLTRMAIARRAWPIILANASVPLLGLVDTAVIGHFGGTADLGALALGALLFNFVYWSFGFLRMATTGFVAQAAGAGDEAEVRAALLRPLLMGLALGVAVWLLQWPLAAGYFRLMDAGDAVAATGSAYFRARVWGAPAALALYALCGALIGLGYSRTLLAVQLLLNGLNAGLDVYFAGVLGWGAHGIGLGTAIAEWSTCVVAAVAVWRVLRGRHRDAGPFLPWARIGDRARLRRTLAANGDIMLRTLCLLAGFGLFARQGTALGDATLAANHLLLQLVSFSAFFLDGFAFVAEALVGAAVGANDRARFRHAVRLSSELALATAVLLAAGLWLGGGVLVGLLTSLQEVAALARAHLPWAALYVLLSVAAFQLDGVFIGATRTREMRNAGVASLAVFALCAWPATAAWGNHGLWAAFVLFVVARALALLPYYRALARSPGIATPCSGACGDDATATERRPPS